MAPGDRKGDEKDEAFFLKKKKKKRWGGLLIVVLNILLSPQNERINFAHFHFVSLGLNNFDSINHG